MKLRSLLLFGILMAVSLGAAAVLASPEPASQPTLPRQSSGGVSARFVDQASPWGYRPPSLEPGVHAAYLPLILLSRFTPPGAPPTPTSTTAPSAGCWEGLTNGGFETDVAWIIRSNPVLAAYVTTPVHGGSHSMRTGIGQGSANMTSYSPIEQAVTFPAGLASATLTFWRYNVNGDVATAAAAGWQPDPASLPRTEADRIDSVQVADYFYALAILPDGAIDYLVNKTINAPSWRARSITLNASRYAGKSIRFQFGTYNNGTGGISRTFVDDVSLTFCPPTGTPTQTATPTATEVGASPTPAGTRTPIPTAMPGFVPTPYWTGRLNLPAGSRPHGVAVNAAGDRVYVAFHGVDHNGHTLGVVNEYLSLQARIDIGSGSQGPNGVAVIPSNGRVVVANRQTANAAVVDPVAGAVVQTVAANFMPDGVIVEGGYGYIANYGNDTVTVFDPTTLAVIRTLSGVGHEPAMFAGDSASGDVYLSAHGSNQVFVLRDGQVAAHWDNISEPYGLSFDPASRRLYVANRGTGHTVTVLDVYHDWIVGTIPLLKEPFVLFVNPGSGHLFIACGDRVEVYDTMDWRQITSIPVPDGAEEGIAFDPRLDKIYVTSGSSDALTVIQDEGPEQVVFASDRDGNGEIYRMLPDGRNQVRLTFTADALETTPTGSLDGRWIAYERHDAGDSTYSQIWVMSRDGRGAHMLTEGPFNSRNPAWSPDSQKIAFASDRDGDWEIYVYDLVAHTINKVTDNLTNELHPDWSFSTDRIAYTSDLYTPNGEIFVMNADGSDAQRLTINFNGDGGPSWEPAFYRIAFWGSRPQGQGIYTMKSDGTDITLLVPQSLRPGGPAWGLVGDAILFSGYRPDSGYSEIMRVQPDVSGLVLLTHNEVNFDYAPGWLSGR